MIKEITFQECLPLWQLLWADRVSPIEPTSAMVIPLDVSVREYSTMIGKPTFLGYFENNILVGVNSHHPIQNFSRSRGLYVLGSHRGKGIAVKLLKETIARCHNLVWSYPKDAALSVYLRAGFHAISGPIVDTVDNKTNYYVSV